MQNYQILGADSSKTLFNAAEFATLKKKLCRESQPLVLVKGKPVAGPIDKFILGSEFMKRVDGGEVSHKELSEAQAYIFHAANSKRPDVVLLSLVMASDPGLNLLDALLAVNSLHQGAFEVHKRQYLIAAMMSVGILEVTDPVLATQILQRIPEKSKQAGLDAALLDCVGHKNPNVANSSYTGGPTLMPLIQMIASACSDLPSDTSTNPSCAFSLNMVPIHTRRPRQIAPL